MFHPSLNYENRSAVRVAPQPDHLRISPVGVQLFSGLRAEQVKAIESAATLRKFETSRIIARASEPAKRLFLIRKGYVDYHIMNDAGQHILLRRLTPGEIFGVASILSSPLGYLGTAKAVTHVDVLEWNQGVVRELAKVYPRLMENALRTSLRYLAIYAKRHIGLVSDTAQERLACALSSLGTRTGRLVPAGVEVEVKNEDLASLADVSFYTACRVLKHWDWSGAVEKTRGKVVIRSPEKLLAKEL